MKTLLTLSVVCTVLLSCKESLKEPLTNFEHLQDSTSVVVQWESSSYSLSSINAYTTGNKVSLTLNNFENSIIGFDIQMENEAGRWKAIEVSQNSIPTDCLYVASQYRILNQSIQLNKPQYKSGDDIKGFIELLMLGRKDLLREPEIPFVDNRPWDTIHVKGHFSKLVE